MRIRQEINGQLNNKKSGAAWSKQFNIKIINYIPGFETKEAFEKLLISLEDFTMKASLCEVERPSDITRRDANKLKKTLNYNLQ